MPTPERPPFLPLFIDAQGLPCLVIVGMGKGGSYKISIKRKLNIGDTYQGGIIFYIDGSGEHGLIAQPHTDSRSWWWNGSNVETGATGRAVGTGRANTKKIIAKQGAGDYAATVADNPMPLS